MLCYPPDFLGLPATLVLFLLLWVGLLSESQAQEERCGTTPYQRVPHQLRFERWMQEKISPKQLRTLRSTDDEPIYRIPVVVHVVHQGEEAGEGSNIPLEQIQDQIRILNEDFRRMNPDTINTPAIFLPVAADTRIEFVLAQQDPDGLPTNGVVRIEGDQDTYGLLDSQELSALSQWDPMRYMNIWVAPLRGGLLGFAQLPVSNLPGLIGSSNNSDTDGVVIDYRSFGSIGSLRDRYNGGRTTTHEVGHFLGLRHTWGDGDCSVDDFVEDTPLQEDSYNGCPVDAESCGSPDMYDNYMDLTDDACMNIFTEGQKLRMRTVLESSPRRVSLLSSPGLEVPAPILNDATISRIITPQSSECGPEVTPRIDLRNTGINPISSVTVAFSVEEAMVEEATFDIDLASGDSQALSFLSLGQNIGLVQGVIYEASFEVLGVNGLADDNAVGNTRSVTFIIPQEDEVPLVENFENEGNDTFLAKSIIRNPDGQITWELQPTPTTTDPNNDALYINFYDYEALEGERDFLYSPTLDLTNIPAAVLSFRVAHAPYAGEDSVARQDGLLVGVSTDCGATIDDIVYEKFGDALATQPAQSNPFAPVNEDDWREEIISLNAYLGEPNVQLVFIGVNDHGNNVYLDDIEFFVTEYDSLRPAESTFSIEPNPIENNQVNVEFNLPFKDDVTIAIYTTQGLVVGQYLFPNTLNQTYTIDMGGRPAGVYVLRVFSRTASGGKQFILQ